jgi:hypothetical protein
MAATIAITRTKLADIQSQCENMGLEMGRDYDFVWTENIDSGWAMVIFDDSAAVIWQLKYGDN